jgi:hypothetical protein
MSLVRNKEAALKHSTPANNCVIRTREEFHQYVTANFAYFLERSSGLIRRILQDTGQWTDNAAHEKLLLRLSFELVERFIKYCPSQVPCRPPLLLDGFISDFFGRSRESQMAVTSNSILYRFLDGLLNRAVVSRDALICLFYHFYGMKPVEVGCLLGLEEGQTQRIYKNFARWRQKGWCQAVEEVGVTSQDLHALVEDQAGNPEDFHAQVREHLETLLPFYRKSDPAYYPCLETSKWRKTFLEGRESDYRTWHLPLCLSCMKKIAGFGGSFLLNQELTLHFHVAPHSLKEEEVLT